MVFIMKIHRLTGLLFFAVVLALGVAGCRSTTATTARYRGDALYGDDNRHGKPGKGHKKPHRQPFDIEAYARDVTDPYQRALVAEIASWLGTPYRWGGQTKDGTDCSGLVMAVYQNVTGIKLPRVSREQSRYVAPLHDKTLEPGDLLFFAPDSDLTEVTHVGMYVGKGRMIHSSASRGVMVSDVGQSYWQTRLFNAGKVPGALMAWQQRAGMSSRKTKSESGNNSFDDMIAGVQAQDAGVPAVHDPADNGAAVSAFNLDELLESAISQKADSIFSSQFMD